MKIGIVTLHNYNFGSALQCYATQTLLQRKGSDSEVIDLSIGVGLIKGRFKTVCSLLFLCIKNPKDCKKILRMFTAQRGKSLTMSTASLYELQKFNNTILRRRTYSFARLKRLAHEEGFGMFLSGSDQVWNGSRINEYDKYFLRFAPSSKKASWAASFGEGEVAKYNIKRYRKYIKDYNYISVREESGVKLVSDLTGRKATLLADPVMMLDASDWKAIEEENHMDPYILAFFLDKPSDKALSGLDELRGKTGSEVVTFGYEHPEISPAIHYDGGPFDFVAMIDNAEYVLTDSFHAIAFASLFHKRFYIFERMYVHGQSQSSRVIDFLKSVKLTGRYEPEGMSDKEPDFSAADRYFEEKREQGTLYLNNILKGVSTNKENQTTVRKERYECCGCGACVNVCGHHAITMETYEDGVVYPTINQVRCVGCGLCRKVCAFESLPSPSYQQKSYVAACIDNGLLPHSASGGVFAAMARETIEEGGIVFGCSLWMEEGGVHCEHIGIESLENLWRIQGSKYVHSDTQNIFPVIKDEVNNGRRVLFGGTSCQVAALKSYLRKDYENLLTTDLVCHGVPDLKVLQDYIDYLSVKYKEEIIDFKFRVRDEKGNPYTITVTLQSGKKVQIRMRESAYYRMFMACVGYRPSCYNCPFASPNKPGDITLGDYYPKDRTILEKGLQEAEMLSSVIINTEKGHRVFSALDKEIYVQEIPLIEMVQSHELLQHSSTPNLFGDAMFAQYKEAGFAKLQRQLAARNRITRIPGIIKRWLH